MIELRTKAALTLRLTAAGKRQTLVTTAIAREMAAFLWAIGHEGVPLSVAT
jgi:transposase